MKPGRQTPFLFGFLWSQRFTTLNSILTNQRKRRLKYSVTLGRKNEFFNTIVVFILIFDATLRAEALRSSSR